jgi:hypothetical protein
MSKTSQKNQKRINECLRLLDNSFRNDFNSIRINTHNNLSHEMAKTIKAYELVKLGKTILTEAVFKSGGRCDILILNDFQVIEILDSETQKEALKKVLKYPTELDVITIEVKDIIKEVPD